MAKFFRLIFNLLLVCYIAAACALFIPPLVGVTTAVTLEETSGNQETGAVNYGWKTPVRMLQTGDGILVTGQGEVNVYEVQSVDTDNSVVTAADGTQVNVRSYVHKLMLTVPYLGYISICMQTFEGTVTLAAVGGILLVLCILTGIWCKKSRKRKLEAEEEELADRDENEFFSSLASQKRESDSRSEEAFRTRRMEKVESERQEPVQLDEELEEFPDPESEETVPEREEPVEEEQQNPDEPERKDQPEEEELPVGKEHSEDEPGEADKSLPEAGTAEDGNGSAEEEDRILETEEEMAVERAVETGNIPGVQATLEAALDTQQIQRPVRRREIVQEPETETEPLAAEEIELAMPVHTVDEYLKKAYEEGQDPLVRTDELTGVQYVDYSECL